MSDSDVDAFLAEIDEGEGQLEAREALVVTLYEDRPLAHEFVFKHRHPLPSPAFHEEMIEAWHDPDTPNYLAMAFREGAKSTVGEEATVLKGLFREFKNGLVIGANKRKAVERLHSIKNEFENNEIIQEIWGDVRDTRQWSEDEIVLNNGTRILALGKGASLRGTKYEDTRPDYLFIDDLEDEEDVRTPDARKQMLLWFRNVLIPACARGGTLVRMAATPLDRDCVAERLAKDQTWKVGRYPAVYLDEDGQRQATWPESLDLKRFETLEYQAAAEGRLNSFRAEYMCEAETSETKPFKHDMIITEPRVRKWEAVYCMFDPARTAKATSATTGFAAWSWINNRLIIWDAWARILMPDEIIQSIFEAYATWNPVYLGVEEDGLNEFILQPLRQEQLRRGETIPIKALKAPRSKLDFIRGLQPFFQAREARFAKDLPDLREQLLNFPTGKIDAPNALAYAIKMHMGAPVYPEFSDKHVGENLEPSRAELFLVMNASKRMVTSALCQMIDGALRVYKAWVAEGEPTIVTETLLQTVALSAMRRFAVVTGPRHFDQFANVGLNQAIKRAKYEVRKGTDVNTGRAHISQLLGRQGRAGQMFMVSAEAPWVLNGMGGGYARTLDKQGRITEDAEDNEYRVVLEGLESFAGLMTLPSSTLDEDAIHYSFTPSGQRYASARR